MVSNTFALVIPFLGIGREISFVFIAFVIRRLEGWKEKFLAEAVLPLGNAVCQNFGRLGSIFRRQIVKKIRNRNKNP